MPYRKSKLTPEMSYYPLRGEDQSGGMESMEQEANLPRASALVSLAPSKFEPLKGVTTRRR